MALNNPYINWKTIENKKCLYFKFDKNFSLDQAEKAAEEWVQYFNSVDNSSILIWDCNDMENYESKARVLWQKTIRKLKAKIASIWVITNSTNIQAGAEIISFFTSYTIKVVRSEEELAKKISK